jgi:hypothetical protein
MCRVKGVVSISTDGPGQTSENPLPCHKPRHGNSYSVFGDKPVYTRSRLRLFILYMTMIVIISSYDIYPLDTQASARPHFDTIIITVWQPSHFGYFWVSFRVSWGSVSARKQFRPYKTSKGVELNSVSYEIKIAINLHQKHVARFFET